MGAARAVVFVAVTGLVWAALATGATVQKDGLRVTVLSQVQPHRLPRTETAPIAVFLSGHLASADGGIPPQLRQLTIEVNRHGHLGPMGLPLCRRAQIEPASTERALENCGPALIGAGQFWAHIVLPGQDPYPTHGRLLVFNGRHHRHQSLLAHIYTSSPFNASFVIVFAIKRIDRGAYGIELKASLPATLGEWGYVDRIKLTLRREYRFRGAMRSYFRASCAVPAGARVTVFPLARATFDVGDREPVSVQVENTCGVKGL